jgi:hypothetical protein
MRAAQFNSARGRSVRFLAHFVDKRGIVKTLRFKLGDGGISFSFDVQDKLDRGAVGREGLAQARQDYFSMVLAQKCRVVASFKLSAKLASAFVSNASSGVLGRCKASIKARLAHPAPFWIFVISAPGKSLMRMLFSSSLSDQSLFWSYRYRYQTSRGSLTFTSSIFLQPVNATSAANSRPCGEIRSRIRS